MEIKDLDNTLTELTQEEMSSLTGAGFNFGNTGDPRTGGYFNPNGNSGHFTGTASSGNEGPGTGGYFNPNSRNPHNS